MEPGWPFSGKSGKPGKVGESLSFFEKSGNFIILMKRNVAHEGFPYSFTSAQKKISCLEVWEKQGKVREDDRDEKMATLRTYD